MKKIKVSCENEMLVIEELGINQPVTCPMCGKNMTIEINPSTYKPKITMTCKGCSHTKNL